MAEAVTVFPPCWKSASSAPSSPTSNPMLARPSSPIQLLKPKTSLSSFCFLHTPGSIHSKPYGYYLQNIPSIWPFLTTSPSTRLTQTTTISPWTMWSSVFRLRASSLLSSTVIFQRTNHVQLLLPKTPQWLLTTLRISSRLCPAKLLLELSVPYFPFCCHSPLLFPLCSLYIILLYLLYSILLFPQSINYWFTCLLSINPHLSGNSTSIFLSHSLLSTMYLG